MFGRQKVAALVAEFLGTGLLTLLTLGTLRSQLAVGFFIALAAGLSLALATFTFARTSGGHFNPALTFALAFVRKVSPPTAVLYIVVQFLGAFAALHLFQYITKADFTDLAKNAKYTPQLLVAQIVGTGIFALGWASALYQRFTAATTASVAGLAYVVGILFASTSTLGLLNPALALGTRSFVWNVYLLGPVIGALVGVFVYSLLFAEAEELADVAETAATGVTTPVTPTAVTVAATTSATATRATAKRATSTAAPAKKRANASTTRAKSTAARPKRKTTRK